MTYEKRLALGPWQMELFFFELRWAYSVHALLVFTAADENWVRDVQHGAVNPACFRDKAARVSCLCNRQKRNLCDMCVTFIWSRGRRLQAATLRATTTLHQRTAAGQISGATASAKDQKSCYLVGEQTRMELNTFENCFTCCVRKGFRRVCYRTVSIITDILPPHQLRKAS